MDALATFLDARARMEVVDCVAGRIREILRTKEYGTFGIAITMHEGQPLKICEQNEINLIRRPGNRVVISK